MAGEVAYDDILKRGREGRTKGVDLSGLSYAEMDENSEVTSDFTKKHVDKFFNRIGSALTKVSKWDINGAVTEAKQTAKDVKRVLTRDIQNISKGGNAAKQTIDETLTAVSYAVTKSTGVSSNKSKKTTSKPKKNKNSQSSKGEKLKKQEEIVEKLKLPDCGGICVKEQQKTYDDRSKDYASRIACYGEDFSRKDCNPSANHMTELIIVETDAQLIEISKLLGSERKNYRIDSRENINRKYNNASLREKQAIDYGNVINRIKSTGKSADELYQGGQITRLQYENYGIVL